MSKSILRVAAGYCLATSSLVWAGLLFVIAEVLGIVEEF
jgi:hypothetical protein